MRGWENLLIFIFLPFSHPTEKCNGDIGRIGQLPYRRHLVHDADIPICFKIAFFRSETDIRKFRADPKSTDPVSSPHMRLFTDQWLDRAECRFNFAADVESMDVFEDIVTTLFTHRRSQTH